MNNLIASPDNPEANPESNPNIEIRKRLALLEQVQTLERLLSNPDFQAVTAYHHSVLGGIKAQAQNVGQNNAEQRLSYWERYGGMLDAVQWPAEQLAADRASLKSFDEGQR